MRCGSDVLWSFYSWTCLSLLHVFMTFVSLGTPGSVSNWSTVFNSDQDNRSLNSKAVKIDVLGHWSQYWGKNKPGGIVEFFNFCGPRRAFSCELKIPIFSWDSWVNPLCNVLFNEFVLTQSPQAWWTSWISCWQICSNQVAGDDAL